MSNSSLSRIAARDRSISTSGLAAGVDLSSAEGSIVKGLRVAGIVAQSGPAIAANRIVKGNTVVGFGGTPGAAAAIFRHQDGDRQLRQRQTDVRGWIIVRRLRQRKS